MYSIANGDPSSKWLYGASDAPVSITRYGAGQRLRLISCQQPGLPSGPPCAFTRGRLSGYTYGFPAPTTSACALSEYPLPPSESAIFGATSWKLRMVQRISGLYVLSSCEVGIRSSAPRVRYGPPRSNTSAAVLPNPIEAISAASMFDSCSCNVRVVVTALRRNAHRSGDAFAYASARSANFCVS